VPDSFGPDFLTFIAPGLDFPTALKRLIGFVCVTPVRNVTGSPALSLPMGQSANRLPRAVQLAAAFGQERTLLELAFALEEAVSPPAGRAPGPLPSEAAER